MLTPWGEKLDREKVLKEYPRPQLERESYLNLNGEWDYCINSEEAIPTAFDGKILVPFSPEAELSGVGKALSPGEFLWYRLATELPEGFRTGRLLLHFGAVDQIATVWVNGYEVMRHTGGYTPFSMDITDAVPTERLIILVRVQDFSERSQAGHGKQRLTPGGIWHTAQSGIWQTVWLESVPERYIHGLRTIPHFDDQQVELWVAGEGRCDVLIDGKAYSLDAGAPAVFDVEEMHPWSPEDPYLYSLELTLGEDHVKSYFAMRKFSVETDPDGERRLFLNGAPYFHNGVLDQGYWPDGLMTAPSDAAMIFDISTARSMGFNMLRKHEKLESARWYYHCDRLGMLVWQDIPSGGMPSALAKRAGALGLNDGNYRLFGRNDEEGRKQYLSELRETVNALFNCPCVAVWTLFTEGRGQFDSAKLCARLRRTDSSRPIDHASGFFDQKAGDIRSRHLYGKKFVLVPDEGGRACALSEFGGYAHRVEGHCYSQKSFGFRSFDSPNSYKFAIRDLYRDEIYPAFTEGLSAAVYTQLTDVEDELDGLITYDRKMTKLAPSILKGMLRIQDR